MPGRHHVLAVAILVGVAGLPPTYTAAPVQPGDELTLQDRHIRFRNDRIDEAFRYAIERSPAFRDLVADIESSRVLVHIEDGGCAKISLRSCLQIVEAPGPRQVIIRLDARLSLPDVVGQLAHELGHAAEVSHDGRVVDAPSLSTLYSRTGFPNCSPGRTECWETRGAQDLERRVLVETKSNPGARIHTLPPSYFGRWQLNAAASVFDNVPVLKDAVRVQRDRGYGLVSVATWATDASNAQIETAFVYRPDGRDYAMDAGRGLRRTIAIDILDEYAVNCTIKQGGEIVSTGGRTLSRDGQTMIISSSGVDDDGAATLSVTVWERVDGDARLSRR